MPERPFHNGNYDELTTCLTPPGVAWSTPTPTLAVIFLFTAPCDIPIVVWENNAPGYKESYSVAVIVSLVCGRLSVARSSVARLWTRTLSLRVRPAGATDLKRTDSSQRLLAVSHTQTIPSGSLASPPGLAGLSCILGASALYNIPTCGATRRYSAGACPGCTPGRCILEWWPITSIITCQTPILIRFGSTRP